MTADKMGSPAVSRWTLIFLAVILAVGISVRFHDLAWHFGTTDDMGVAKDLMWKTAPHDFFSIPRNWTYAPLQFFLTKLLISKDQTYRDALFYGRLPSCAAGIAALFAMVWFYRRLEGRLSERLLLPLTLLVCSWGAIAHSKQMHNYEMGVLSAILLFIAFVEFARRKNVSWKVAMAGALILWVLGNAHYEILFFLPAFFSGGLFTLRETPARERPRLFFRFLAAGSVFLLLYFPTWYYFLRHNAAKGINAWSSGRSGEYVFAMPAGAVVEKLLYSVKFFAYNFSLVIQSNLGFMPEELFTFKLPGFFLVFLFAAGFTAMLLSRDRMRKKLGVFFLVLTATWFGLVMLHKIALGPTRHALILLPFFCVVIGEGADRLFAFFRPYPLVLSGAVLSIFLFFYPSMAQERHDVFDEQEIHALITKYNIQGIFTADYSDPLNLMKSVSPYIKGLGWGNPAWIGHSGPIDFPFILKMHGCCSQNRYELVYKKEIESYREVDFSKKANQDEARNRIFVYVARRIEA